MKTIAPWKGRNASSRRSHPYSVGASGVFGRHGRKLSQWKSSRTASQVQLTESGNVCGMDSLWESEVADDVYDPEAAGDNWFGAQRPVREDTQQVPLRSWFRDADQLESLDVTTSNDSSGYILMARGRSAVSIQPKQSSTQHMHSLKRKNAKDIRSLLTSTNAPQR
eukprot:CAMPEP_0185850768 /NCGR_PEP_ID=MMETSP1354-20130828/4781_1 /TAXON_ID=708628 /ORGANISM="Erythrolobus madagascarensis, Strain CCMP3276" /LENGTH=165 /DNA_ID=CAMNT_0028551485 /DNA_START=123 /DNA_END=620 /DNA_ORIENTATION=-